MFHLVFPKYVTQEGFADLTQREAEKLSEWLEAQKTKGRIVDYYLGPPYKMTRETTLIWKDAKALQAELEYHIELEERAGDGN